MKQNQNFFDKLFEDDDFPELEELFKISQKNEKNFKLYKKLENFVKENLKSFNDLLEKNIATEKIYSTSGRTISTKAFFNNFVCSGFTNPKIFEQNGLVNKRSYNLVYVIDISNFVLFDFNRSQTLATIILLLLAPSIIDENE